MKHKLTYASLKAASICTKCRFSQTHTLSPILETDLYKNDRQFVQSINVLEMSLLKCSLLLTQFNGQWVGLYC